MSDNAEHVCRCDYCAQRMSFVSVGELCEAAADKALADERERIRQGSDYWQGGIAGPAWYKVPAHLLEESDDN